MVLVMAIAMLDQVPFDFKGGPVESLAAYTSDYFAKPVVLAVESENVSKAFLPWPTDRQGEELVESEGFKIQLQKISAHLGADVGGEDSYAFRRNAMPWHRFPMMYKGRNPLQYRLTGDIVVVRSGQVTLSPKKGHYFSPTFFPIYSFRKPVRAHSFFENYPVSLSAGKVSEAEFLKALASSIGGTVVEKEKEVFIDLDLDKLREQLKAKFKRDGDESNSVVEKARSVFQVEAIDAIPDDKLRQMFEKENYLDVSGMEMISRANQLAREYVRIYLEEAAKSNGDPYARRANAELVRQNGDFNRPFKIAIDSRGDVGVFIRYVGSEGGTGL